MLVKVVKVIWTAKAPKVNSITLLNNTNCSSICFWNDIQYSKIIGHQNWQDCHKYHNYRMRRSFFEDWYYLVSDYQQCSVQFYPLQYFTIPFTAFHANFTHESRIVTSPSYPNSYSTMVDCIFIISHENGSSINFTLVNMDIDCEGDYLELRDGKSETSPLIGRFCGIRSIPAFMQTSHNYIRAR